MFSPLDILYIVLAFCALWFTAAAFWLIWQVASILRTFNQTMQLAQETFNKIEVALTGIRKKFDSTTGALGLVVDMSSKVLDYVLTKQVKKRVAPKKKTTKKK